VIRYYVSIEFHNWLVLAGFRQAKKWLVLVNRCQNGRQDLNCPNKTHSVYMTNYTLLKVKCCQNKYRCNMVLWVL